MNILQRFIKKIKKENPYAKKYLKDADIIIGKKEKLNVKERRERFSQWYERQKNNGTI
jgi:hypothetical protein